MATLSGLRAEAVQSEPSELLFKSFIARPENSFAAELRNERTRGEFLSALPPLPAAAGEVEPTLQSALRLELLSFDESFVLPPPLPPKPASAVPRKPRTSSTFASLFVGSGRGRQAEADRDGVRDNVNLSAASDAETGEEALGPDRHIGVCIVDRIIKRREVLSTLGQASRARVGQQLSEAGISEGIIEVIDSFITSFLPPDHASKGSAVSPASPHSGVSGAPYLSGPDDLADNFQNFYRSIYSQIEEQMRQESASESSDSFDEKLMSRMALVESSVTGEVYDRIYTPFTARDHVLDLTLSARIAALNLLGVTLSHLGIALPSEETPEGKRTLASLATLTTACGRTLAQLNDADKQTPAAKLAVLTALQTQVADALGSLSGLEHKEEAKKEESSEGSGAAAEGERPSKPSTASADLILPLLIYSIIRSNPLHLVSNLLYIQRYRAEALLRGESAYSLVNMQAAVAFIENVEPAALGFEGVGPDILPRSTSPMIGGPSSRSTSSSKEALSAPNQEQLSISDRLRARFAADFTGFAGASNKVIGDVLDGNFSAWGRNIASSGSGQNTPPVPTLVANQTMDDFRARLAAQGSRKSTDVEDRPTLRNSRIINAAKDDDTRSIRSTASASRRKISNAAPTDYGSAEEVARDAAIGVPIEPKLSFSERLANLPVLGRLGMQGPSPSPGTRELPLPPAPEKVAAESSLPASLRSPYAPLLRPPTAERPLHVVLASTGSVASIKIPLIVERLLAQENVRVQVIATKASLKFYEPSSLPGAEAATAYDVAALAEENRLAPRGQIPATVLPRCKVWTDAEEWDQWDKVGDPILHIELRRWADIVLVAPCSADTLAKISNGICDNLLVSQVALTSCFLC